MTMIAQMPGHWPRDLRDETEMDQELHFQESTSRLGETLQQLQTINISSSSRNSHDELFFDCPSPARNPAVEQDSEASSSSYLIFEPVVSSVPDIQETDWRRFDPPRELLNSQASTSAEVQRLLAPSIERIQIRHQEEEERRAAAARRERPLARVGRASIKPRREVAMSGGLHPSDAIRHSRSSGVSVTSLSSSDSGYASMSPEIESPSSSIASTRRSFGGLTTLFKRKDKTVATFEGHGQNTLQIPPIKEAPLATSPAREAPSPALTGECVSCLDDFATAELIKLSCHSYCSECFQRLINTALESETHWPAKCCLNTIPSVCILPHIDAVMAKRYRQREVEWSIPAGDRIYCAQPSCSAWISPKRVNQQLHNAKCGKCGHRSCTTCRGKYHNGEDCPQDPALQATINLAEMEGWKRCFSCHALVEHNKGCRHMTCRCKAQFCYICGLKWRTCACTDTQLATIQQQAETRRQDQTARTARAAAAAEEERIVLQMVADFERAEAERMAAEAEAQRRRQEEERRRREEERIAAVNLRFHQLRTELESLHDVQRVLIAERYEFEVEVLKKDRQDALDTLALRHPSELQILGTESQKRIEDSEHKFDKEYQVRLAEERRIEDDYVDQLRAFWKGKAEAEYKVREARDELRRDQDKEYKFWDSYRRKQLQAIVEGENRKMEALRVRQGSEIKAVEGRAKIDEVEWRRKRWAEGKWVEVVASERVTMLQAQEQEAYARGD